MNDDNDDNDANLDNPAKLRRLLYELNEGRDDPIQAFKKTKRETTPKQRTLALSPREVRRKKLLSKAIEDANCKVAYQEKAFVVIVLILLLSARQKLISVGQFLREERNGKVCLALLLITYQRRNDYRNDILRFKESLIDLTAIFETDLARLSPKKRKMNRKLDDFVSQEDKVYQWTRFTLPQLRLLLVHLRLPEEVRIDGYVWHGEEILLISLTRFALGENYSTMEDKFGGNSARYPAAFWWFTRYTCKTFFHKISGDSMNMWVENNLEEYRRVIHKFVVEPRETANGVEPALDIDFNDFLNSGFMDDTVLKSCRVGAGPVNDNNDRREDAHDLQRAFFK